MSVHVEILGPLGRENESFHVHAVDCRDITTRRYNAIQRDRAFAKWTAEISTIREAVEEVYSDFIFQNDQNPWEDYENDVRVFPCVGTLPRDAS